MNVARLALALAGLALAAGCDTTYHARLNDGAGLGEGDPVIVSGVRVGQVEAVRVIEGQVDVELAIDDDHEVTLRTDACAMAVPQQGQPTLVIAPGTGALLEEDRPIPQCELGGGQLRDLMRGLGEGLGQMLEQLGQGLLGGGGSGTSPSPLPQLPLPLPSPGSPSSPNAPNAPPPPPPRATRGAACEAVRVRVDRVEDVAPVPLLLADGGHRVWLVFDNDGAETMEIGPLSEATFSDPDGRALHPARMPSESQGWFMPFTVPAGGSARRSVVFEGSEPPRVDRIEARRSSVAGQPLDDCVVTASGVAPIST